MVRKFDITDIVMVNGDDNTLFMVVDCLDFSGKAPNGKMIEDIDYELMQVYPVQKNSKYATVSQNDLTLREKEGTRNYELLMSMISKDRQRIGLYGKPDFIEVANRNLKSINAGESTAKEVKMPMQKLDIIRYDQLDTIDKCLDALNDLDTLHKMFSDDAYLQIKEVVTARIIRLNK